MGSIKPDGSDEVVLNDSGDIDINVFGFTSSGRVIYQVSGGTTSSVLFSVNADGSDPAVLADSIDASFAVDILF